ncbi:MAG: hypothetical protein J6T22_09485 [Bacteroidales bacterium]|nr:hypothetical protein [Bacteroidales bacterium]MBO7617426.1 hypothetical protein [Bacteroidales bacterium]
MKIIERTKMAGDCSQWFNVTEYKAKTVGEFVDEVLPLTAPIGERYGGFWGDVRVMKREKGYFDNNPKCEFKDGVLLTTLPDELLGLKIKNVELLSCWNECKYYIQVKRTRRKK